MRLITSAAQVRRIAGIEGPGDFPDYPYGDPIPREVPDGHFKFPHLWPLKLPQAGRSDYGFPDPV